MPWVGPQCVIVAYHGHTQLLFCNLLDSFALILQFAEFYFFFK